MDEMMTQSVHYDLRTTPLREVNKALHNASAGSAYVIDNPDGAHNVAVGLDARCG